MKKPDDLLAVLQARFEKHMARHPGLVWAKVAAKLSPKVLATLSGMEESGGEPDVVLFDDEPKALYFVDCSPESPAGRRSLCYDKKALDSRKENKPSGSALGMAENMGITLLNEAQYRALQLTGPFDLKTSSWIDTPGKIRDLGGALFGDRRYDRVFAYHNGAESYYGVRGFRGRVKA